MRCRTGLSEYRGSYSKDKSPEEKLYLRLLLVTDSICGMTDSRAKMILPIICKQMYIKMLAFCLLV